MAEKIDRLSALLARFDLRFQTRATPKANLFVTGNAASRTPDNIVFFPMEEKELDASERATVLITAHVDWGGFRNPLLCALPDKIRHRLHDDPTLNSLSQHLVTEFDAMRCGAGTVITRLGEAIMVRLLRDQIEQSAEGPGLLAGLADPRLSRAIVAMHETPGQAWRVETLAQEAGLSSSRFAEVFRDKIGVTPLAYLREWRLSMARKDIEQGDQVQSVAHRYCYGSTEALSRAITQAYGTSPRMLKKAAMAEGNP